jgi:hypothetical protein
LCRLTYWGMRIIPVSAHAGLAEFIEFPWSVYADDASWIPPLREQIFYELSERSVFARYARTRLFLCETGGRIAGRIAAIVNPRLVDRDARVLGQLGYFECINDDDIAAGLIHAGIEWLRLQGAGRVLAPMNGGAHKMHRFLTRGFDREPFLWEPRNPPYYSKLFERADFTPVQRWFSYELTRDDAARHAKSWERVVSRRPAPGKVEELPIDHPLLVDRIYRMLDRCWAGHPGYASLEMDEFQEVFRGPLLIMGPGHVAVFVQNNVDLGFSFIYPDYGAEVRALAGRASGWGSWLGQPLPPRVVLHTIALCPEIRQTSAAFAQLVSVFGRALADGFSEFMVALVTEGFLEKIGESTREYTLYSRSL